MSYKYNHPYTVEEFKKILSELPLCFEALVFLDNVTKKIWLKKLTGYENYILMVNSKESDEVYKKWTHDNFFVFYKGIFTLVDPCEGKRPQAFEVGDKVQILDNIKECKNYHNWADKKEMVGTVNKIKEVFDDGDGLIYEIGDWTFPHYCLKKIESPKLAKKSITLELTEEQLKQIKEILNN